MQTNKGFTIIELIVVIAIIAVLAAIVLVNVTQYIQSAKDAAFVEEANQVSKALTVYFDEHGAYSYYDIDGNFHNFAQSPQYDRLMVALQSQNPVIAFMIATENNPPGFCFCVELTRGGSYCTDSNGYKKKNGNSCLRCNGQCSD